MNASRAHQPGKAALGRGVMVGVGAALTVPAAAHAAPIDDQAPAPAPAGKLDRDDAAAQRKTQTADKAPVPKQPAAPQVQRIGQGDFRPPAPAQATKPKATKPKATKPKATKAAQTPQVQRIGRGDFEPQPTPPAQPVKRTPAKPPQPAAIPDNPRVQRIGQGDFVPRIANPVKPPYDSRVLLGVPTTPRPGVSDFKPHPPPDVISIGNRPDLDPKAPAYGMSFPGGAGDRSSVTLGCGAGVDATREVSRGCSGLRKGSKGRHRATTRGNAGVTVETTVTDTSGRTADTMTPQGERASLQVTSETVLKIGGEAKLKKLNVSYKKIAAGHRTIYQITSTPGRIAQIADNPALAPDANDPRTIQTGDGLLITDENFTGSEGKANVDDVVGGERSKVEGDRRSAGVQRVDAKTIRITVGDDKFVRAITKMGLGNDLAGVGIWSNSDTSDGGVRQVDLDISTRRGWDDYQRFMATGRVVWRPGLKFAIADRQALDYTEGAYIKLGPVEESSTGDHRGSDVRTIRRSDGSTQDVSTFTTNAVTFYRTVTTGRDGTRGPARSSLLVKDARTGAVTDMARRSGGDAGAADGDTEDVRIDFTDQELWRLREQAIDGIRRFTERSGNGTMTRAQTIEFARNPEYGPQTLQQNTQWEMAKARTPRGVLMALYGYQGRASDVIDYLELNPDGSGASNKPIPARVVALPD